MQWAWAVLLAGTVPHMILLDHWAPAQLRAVKALRRPSRDRGDRDPSARTSFSGNMRPTGSWGMPCLALQHLRHLVGVIWSDRHEQAA